MSLTLTLTLTLTLGLLTLALALALTLTQYVRNCLGSHRAEDVMALVEAAPNDIARRFKNLHHKLSH